ncbi:MAG: ABC transporter ATP-binding protein [Oscillatoriaceae cyanobacterium]
MSPYQLLVQFARRQPGWIILTVILGWSGALFNGASTTLLVPLVLGFLGQEVKLEGAPPFMQRIMSLFDGVSENYRFWLMTGAIVLAIVLKNASSYASTLASTYLSKALVKDIRIAGIKLLLDVDIDFYYKTKVGDIVNCVGQEVSRAAGAIRVAIQMLTLVITILVFVAILLSISWQLTIASTLALIMVPAIGQYCVKKSQEFGELLSDSSKRFSSAFIEILNGIRLVKSSSNEEREYQKLVKLIEERETAEVKSEKIYAIIGPINEVTGLGALLIIIAVGRAIFADRIESLSTILLTYLFVLNRLIPLIGQLNNTRSRFANVVPSTIIVNEFLRRDDKQVMKNGTIFYSPLQEGIRFEEVSFAYPGHDELVLDQIDLWLPKGTTLALVGGSGAGKSTLADLVPRFYDPTEGRITIDGIDLRDYDMKTVRRAMGIVSQDTFLFNDSVRANIAYAKPDATDEEVIHAAKLANAYDFIMHLPEGFDTMIGDRGVLLSGGQRQRLAIARALLSEPDILILDEATSALDTVSEHLVQQAIENLRRDRTTLVIAHRLSTVQKADQIAVLEKGRLVELGTHEELLTKGGYYNRLYSLQFTSDSQELMLKKARNETLISTSYEIRTRLNPMIGFLRLLVDEVVDSVEERSELTQESYESAIRLLKTLEFLENSAKLQLK